MVVHRSPLWFMFEEGRVPRVRGFFHAKGLSLCAFRWSAPDGLERLQDGPSYNKHVPNIYFILVFGYACYRRCCGLVTAPYRWTVFL